MSASLPAPPPTALPRPHPACPAGAGGPRRPATGPLLLVVCAALALHALVLGAAPGLPGLDAGPPAAPAPLQTRQVLWPAPQAGAGGAVLPTPASPPSPPPSPPPAPAATRPTPVPVPLASGPTERLTQTTAPAGPAAATRPSAAAQTTAETTAAATPAAAAAAAAADSLDTFDSPAPPATEAADQPPVPVYRTQAAPPATLLFDLQRGLASGQAVLQWRPDPAGARYTLTLQTQAFGVAAAGWNSSGLLGATGLAPERYAETRRNREVRATNFQREQGKVSYSALAAEYPLVPGLQDRSSWLLQLGAILQAQPELAQPGAQITLAVVGTRGAPEPWVFTVVEHGDLELPAATAADPASGTAADPAGSTAAAARRTGERVAGAVQLLREPRRPYDTRARVWLDPARHHLPVKLQLTVAATGEGQVFELRQLTMP